MNQQKYDMSQILLLVYISVERWRMKVTLYTQYTHMKIDNIFTDKQLFLHIHGENEHFLSKYNITETVMWLSEQY